MIIKVDPLDTLFFRDGKPFTMGEDNWANGIFPPPSSVIYGALRSVYFSNHINELKDANEMTDITKKINIKSIYFFDNRDRKVYLPLPFDCAQKIDDAKNNLNEVSLLSMIKLNEIKSSCPTMHALKGGGEVTTVTEGLIESGQFIKYLEGNGKTFTFAKISDKVLLEPKIGIRINENTGTSDEGKLYRVGMNRLDNLSLLIDFEGLDVPEKGIMKLGGEGKAASYKQHSDQNFLINPLITNANNNNNTFKLYLSTPAIFEQGWIPKWVNKDNLMCKYQGLKLKLLTASIGRYRSIGGFDMKTRKPKAMQKAVPAGSVYYFEIIEGNFENAFYEFNNKAISDLNPEQGFGISHVGCLQNV